MLCGMALVLFCFLQSAEAQVIVSLTINPYLTNGLSHHYYLDESTFILRGFRWDFDFLFHFSVKFLQANRIAPDWTPGSAASHLGLFCLPMPHKRDARLK